MLITRRIYPRDTTRGLASSRRARPPQSSSFSLVVRQHWKEILFDTQMILKKASEHKKALPMWQGLKERFWQDEGGCYLDWHWQLETLAS